MIGIYDSGIGGLLVAAQLERRFPGLPLIYCNDTARAPLAMKSRETVVAATRRGLAFLRANGVTLLVIAGNTAACLVEEAAAEGAGLPLLTVLTPTIDQALAATDKGCIGIIGGPAVIASNTYQQMLREKLASIKVVAASCPLVPALVEAGWSHKQETKMILRRYLHPLKEQQIDTLILASGHASHLRPLIQARAGKRVRLIDSSLALVESLTARLDQAPELAGSKNQRAAQPRYFVSDRNPTFTSLVARILARPVELLFW